MEIRLPQSSTVRVNRKSGICDESDQHTQTHARRLTHMTESRHGLQHWRIKSPQFNNFYNIFALIHLQYNTHPHIGSMFPLLSVTVCLVCWCREMPWDKAPPECGTEANQKRIGVGHRTRVFFIFVKLGQKERCYLSAFKHYLSDDLAVLSVDLSDAAPLCQEGEDLIELQREDNEYYKKTTVALLSKRSLWSDGVTLKPQL